LRLASLPARALCPTRAKAFLVHYIGKICYISFKMLRPPVWLRSIFARNHPFYCNKIYVLGYDIVAGLAAANDAGL
jgi:hypothetical protein